MTFCLIRKNRLTVIANFTANSFAQDAVGAGVEYAFNKMFMLRGGYKYTLGQNENDGVGAPVYSGLSGGFSIAVPLKKDNENSIFGIDYAYRATKVWNGTHNISVRFAF